MLVLLGNKHMSISLQSFFKLYVYFMYHFVYF